MEPEGQAIFGLERVAFFGRIPVDITRVEGRGQPMCDTAPKRDLLDGNEMHYSLHIA